MSFALELSSVSKYFGEFRSLNNVSLTVQEGEFFALLGPNGAGKTTLINIIAGLSRASAGAAKVMGFDVVDQFRDARRSIGIVPQELVFDPFFSVRETLRFQSGYFGLKKNDDWIDELLHSLSLMDKADNNMRTLSGGMKRRVMVAQALVHKPPVIVLDEPTAGVDVELRQTLWKFIAGLNQKGHTILLTTHYLEEAETLCNRIAMLKKGEVLTVDTTPNLLKKHANQTLNMQLNGVLPASLQAKVLKANVSEGRYTLALNGPAEIEQILAQCRKDHLDVLECSIEKPDLEEVFVQLMSGGAK
ncbi:MAG: ABC transporter ATP-binding protein [Limnobacter sp.]|jgi:ABC-2 type transport system ATP-binding protein|uniref:ABC transporter ATP-binding protein n=1 Tax=Limnobacter profundi TaxID=2732163 RepID=A0ABX6N9H6_9BURK|nr:MULTISPECIES: ABC transporter ATP-binding protein [unclassified Limnobacter]MAG79344.1 ABC transporter ATP-binding protein [Sutterellaceae bacterium]PZO15223.1 MAG: ABC transporter ATP-binding protein [Betaproteobacteria bacterium]MBT84172.1 ABC transporter ATP-binding protein [Sutterellaceae bacterium]MDP3270905.1 ABC transporter ATP-binding protein [Limnobacter sp.]MDZ4048769.1 ABC transporter ATP-binding protein [Limnobacter sp.]|tara:strand:- start:17200 stop:18108 length:909 start_codon:yes stop_codon:yes gene_type:complete